MDLRTLREVFESRKEEIFAAMTDRIGSFPWTPYQQFLIHTEEGQRRLRIFVDLISRALGGDRDTFLKDQERVGYMRALMEGFGPEILTQFYSLMPEIIWNALKEKMGEGGLEWSSLCGEIQDLNNILFLGYSAIMASYLKVREESINEKVNQLQELQRFTQEIITLFELEELVAFILNRMTSLFQVDEGTLFLFRDSRIQGVYHHPSGGRGPSILDLAYETHREEATLFLAEGGRTCRDIHQSRRKEIVSAPIRTHGRVYGVLCLRNHGEGFTFTDKEFDFFNQFLHIIAVALENAFMLKEVEQAREALRLLTGKMITIQEEERRRVAADIHDTLTQALIGISYKIQFCKELPNRKPEMLADQLNGLLTTINRAIDQSRNLISSLRPDLIDTMGLVPALERHVEGFTRETGIRVRTRFPERLELPSKVNICLFRVAQEALMNVYKHADTDEAEIALRASNGSILFTVSDKGKGFELAPAPPLTREKSQLGLLSLKERIESIGGRVLIETGRRKGCSIRVTIPYSSGQTKDEQNQGHDR